MFRFTLKSGAQMAALAGLAMLAACGESKPKVVSAPPPPPPPPKAVVIPPKPTPPNYASPVLTMPSKDADGLYRSVNRGITPAQTTWNLRSAYNVAALNCSGAAYAEIVVSYRAFLKAHSKGLTAANKKVDAEFKGKYGTRFIPPREKYMTEVYNHFASPPTMPAFCDAMLAISRDAKLVKANDLEGFAARSLPNVEIVFDDFYRRYDKYKVDLADWQAKYSAVVQTK